MRIFSLHEERLDDLTISWQESQLWLKIPSYGVWLHVKKEKNTLHRMEMDNSHYYTFFKISLYTIYY